MLINFIIFLSSFRLVSKLIFFYLSEFDLLECVIILQYDHIIVIPDNLKVAVTLENRQHFFVIFANENVAPLNQGLVLLSQLIKVLVWVVHCEQK